MINGPLACWEKQLVTGDGDSFLCALPTGHDGRCQKTTGDEDISITASCRNASCTSPALITTLSFPELAPGIIGIPRLLCASCGWELWEHHDEDDPEGSYEPSLPLLSPRCGLLKHDICQSVICECECHYGRAMSDGAGAT